MRALTTLPCPFCGEAAHVEPWHGGGKRKHMVSCINDDCYANPGVTGASKHRAIQNWNQRPPARTHEITRRALEESVKLQAHYASLLNAHDGGKREIYLNVDLWIERINKAYAP